MGSVKPYSRDPRTVACSQHMGRWKLRRRSGRKRRKASASAVPVDGAGRNDDAYRSLLLVRRLYPRNWVSARASGPESSLSARQAKEIVIDGRSHGADRRPGGEAGRDR